MSNNQDKNGDTFKDLDSEDLLIDTAEPNSEQPKRVRRKRWPAVVGIIAVVAIAAGAGFWAWHETPGFCGAICHTPMENYPATLEASVGQPAVDKYGNAVSDANGMLAAVHYAEGKDCLSCHPSDINQQLSEGTHWVSGDYDYPLKERSLVQLLESSGSGTTSADGAEFCLREGCHVTSKGAVMTPDDLLRATAGAVRNPHNAPSTSTHDALVYDCSDCHKAHRASVNLCSRCHTDATLPDGWIDYAQDQQSQIKALV
jgi:hypothetical protein